MVKDLRSIFGESYPQVKLRILCKSCNTIGSHFPFKDTIPENCMFKLIYKYTCENCKAFYIGKTQLQFHVRITQHQGLSARTGNELQTKVASDIRDHSLNCNSQVKNENFEVLDRLHDKYNLTILESLHQKTKKPSIGTQQQSTPLICFD